MEIILIHLPDPETSLSLCSGQSFALYSQDDYPRVVFKTCPRCLKTDNESRQTKLF